MSKAFQMTAPVTGDLAELAQFTCSLAEAAASVTRPYFRKPIDIIQKLDNSPVTIADRECETRIRDLITERYPSHGILGEEHGFDGADLSEIWVIDHRRYQELYFRPAALWDITRLCEAQGRSHRRDFHAGTGRILDRYRRAGLFFQWDKVPCE